MYWTAYALFGILEFFSDQLLFWIPLYTLTKCLFLLWLMVPGKNGGSNLVYYKIIRPFFLKHQDSIDAAAKGKSQLLYFTQNVAILKVFRIKTGKNV
jgi:receptor expression-enhancing protein 5/6